jgi:hypothetical protein
MNARNLLLVIVSACAAATVARSGHESPIYPSYYPHEIRIETAAAEEARKALLAGKLHAYVGNIAAIGKPAGDALGSVDALGSFVLARVHHSKDDTSACVLLARLVRSLDATGGKLIVHPYPVTPFHGDYLNHVDLAEAAKEKWQAAGKAGGEGGIGLKIAARSGLAKSLLPPDWLQANGDWDIELTEIDAAGLVASASYELNGWSGPPWLRDGWFHAYRLLAETITDGARREDVAATHARLKAAAYESAVERINLERGLVSSLIGGCRALVVGYSVRRHYFNAQFSAGVENVGFDAIAGFASPIFLRTVKLKEFPWNGWLSLGVEQTPAAAWNPIAGFTDDFGRLLWFAVGDPALVASPYSSGWMFNRVSDVQIEKSR